MDLSARQQSVVFALIYLFRKINITHLRFYLSPLCKDLFTTSALQTKLPVILRTLLREKKIDVDRYGQYSCTAEPDYAGLCTMNASGDFQKLMGLLFAPESNILMKGEFRDFCSFFPQAFCCILLQGSEQQFNTAWEHYKRHCSRYYYYSSSSQSALLDALAHLYSFPEFAEEHFCDPFLLTPEIFPWALWGAMLNGAKLPDWRSLLSKPQRLRAQGTELMTAAFLEADAEMMTKITEDAALPGSLNGAFQGALRGDWKESDRCFTRYINTLPTAGSDKSPMLLLLVFLASLSGCAARATESRLKRWIGWLHDSGYQDVSTPLHNTLCTLQQVFWGGGNSRYMQEYAQSAYPLLRMLYYLAASQTSDVAPDLKITQEAVASGKRMLQCRQELPGIYLLNAAGTLLPDDDPARGEIEELTRKSPVVPLYRLNRHLELWEKKLIALEAAIPAQPEEKKTPAEDRKEAKIFWVLCTEQEQSFRRNLRIIFPGQKVKQEKRIPQEKYLFDIKFFVSKRGKRGEFGVPREISSRSLENGKWDFALSREELALKECFDYGSDLRINKKTLAILENSENVCFQDTEHPVKLERGQNSLVSSINSRGDFELRLKFHPESFYEYWGDNCCSIGIEEPEDGICRYIVVDNRDPLLEFFHAEDESGKTLVIPRSGAKKLQELAGKLSRVLPVSGVLADDAYRELPQISGAIDLHALILREQQDFHIEFRNCVSESGFWNAKPGVGQENKVITVDGKKSLVKRDLAAEKKAFRALLKKCPAVPASAAADCECDSGELAEILEILSELKEAGAVLEWNSGTPLKISSPRDSSHLHLSGGSGLNWFSIGGELEVSPDRMIQLTELLNAVEQKTGCFIRLDDDSYLKLTRDLLKKIESLRAAGTVSKKTLNIAPAALPMLSSVFTEGLPEKLQQAVHRIQETFASEVAIPRNLCGTLRSYQADGFRYLAHLADCRIGCCLADDMGLGKTIQLLSLLLREAKNGPALVVCPASLCRNWEREARKFAPALHTKILPQTDREKTVQKCGKNDLLLCSYGILQSEEKLFAGKEWHCVILDEAQAIKNHTAKRAKAVKQLQAEIRVVSTGTPVENHLLELWSLFDFLNPGLLGSANVFETRFCSDGMARPELKRLVTPLILRRRKDEVLEELPPKTEITIPIELPAEELEKYEVLRRRALEELSGQEKSHIAILAQLMKLRRFCCAPSLVYPGSECGSKLQRITELAQELKNAGHRALIFSQFVDFLHLIEKEFDRAGLSHQFLDGSCSAANRMKSVDAFQNGESDFFLISLKAGGTGLNLTGASYVILADPWWNPAVEDQAADRVHRIGQTQPVTVYRLIASGTVEERVLELHGRKRKLSEDILSESKQSGVTAEELLSLLKAPGEKDE